MNIINKIDSFLNEGSIDAVKKQKAKSLGLAHIAYNHYKNKSNERYDWDDDKNDFLKVVEFNKKNKTVKELYEYMTSDSNRIERLEDFFQAIYHHVEYHDFGYMLSSYLDVFRYLEDEYISIKKIKIIDPIYRGEKHYQYEKEKNISSKQMDKYGEIYHSGGKFIYHPLSNRPYSSWTFDKNVTKIFTISPSDDVGFVVLESKYKKSEKNANLNIFTDLCHSFMNESKGLHNRLYKILNKLMYSDKFNEEKEVVIFGPVKDTKVIEFKWDGK